MFTFAISCLTTSNLHSFMDLAFQIPVQYCSLQHWSLLSPPDTSITGCCFCFGSVISFHLELCLCSSPVAYWAPTDLRVHPSVSYLFTFSYCSWGSQDKNTEVLCHFLLQWPTFCQNSPPWPIHLGWPYTAWVIISLSQKRQSRWWSRRTCAHLFWPVSGSLWPRCVLTVDFQGSGTLTPIVLGGVVCWQGRRRTKSTYNHKAFQDKVWMVCTVSVEDIKKRWQEYTEELYKKDLNDPDNHDGVITHLEPDILECEIKWSLWSITISKLLLLLSRFSRVWLRVTP